MMHMFVCCHVYLEYHLNISKFSGRADRSRVRFKGNSDRAIADFSKAIELNPANAALDLLPRQLVQR